eukprot:3542528-Prymnesium_polylepis.1
MDAEGSLIDRRLAPGESGLQVHIALQSPFLYWADKSQWRWHKRWPIPTITVHVECSRAPLQDAERQLEVMVSAGTVGEDEEGTGRVLEGSLLVNAPAQILELTANGTAEVRFARLKFQQTSYACDGRPLHLVVTICTPPSRRLEPAGDEAGGNGAGGDGAGGEGQLALRKPIVCICSPPVHVDSRKRFRKERPQAAAKDMRFANKPDGVPFADSDAA